MNIDITLEQALQKAPESLRGKIEHSVGLMRKSEKLACFYDMDDGFWLGFSGGKDSQVIYHLAQLAGVRFKAHFSPTSVDPGEVIRFIKTQYPEVKFEPLKTSIYKRAIRSRMLPSIWKRWCCDEFKEQGGKGKVVLVGVRRQESAKRSMKNDVEVSRHKFSGTLDEFADYRAERIAKKLKTNKENIRFDEFYTNRKEQVVTCVSGADKIIVSPILDWTDDDVWTFLNDIVSVPHCELYDQGHTRIGCVLCPMAGIRQKRIHMERWPYVKEKWIRTIIEMIRNGAYAKYRYLPKDSKAAADSRERAENIFDWWVHKYSSYREWFVKRFGYEPDEPK